MIIGIVLYTVDTEFDKVGGGIGSQNAADVVFFAFSINHFGTGCIFQCAVSTYRAAIVVNIKCYVRLDELAFGVVSKQVEHGLVCLLCGKVVCGLCHVAVCSCKE